MEFNSSYAGVMFFVGITVISFAITDSSKLSRFPDVLDTKYEEYPTDPSPHPLPMKTVPISPIAVPTSIPSLPLYNEVLPAQNQVKCEPLKPGYYIEDLTLLLPPDIFSKPDPLGHFIYSMMQRSNSNIPREILILNNLLRTEQFPRCYIPYARALYSLFQCWHDVYTVKQYIYRIRVGLSPKDADFSFLPADISLSPQLLKLFTDGVFADPMPPSRILHKLLDMSKNDVVNLKNELQKFLARLMKELENIPFRQRQYLWYAKAVLKLLQKESALDDLKREITAIQPTGASDEIFLPSTSITSSNNKLVAKSI